MISFDVPLWVNVSKSKKFYMNLNNYRNTHFTALNKAKKQYKLEVMKSLGVVRPLMLSNYKIVYTLYAPDNRMRDLSNVLSIVDKFACDALVELKVLVDDNVGCLKSVVYEYGGVDKSNARVNVMVVSNE
jgi:hypothetical protein